MFEAVSAIFQPYNGGIHVRCTYDNMLDRGRKIDKANDMIHISIQTCGTIYVKRNLLFFYLTINHYINKTTYCLKMQNRLLQVLFNKNERVITVFVE